MNRESLIVVLVLALAAPALAHHNYRLNFDDSIEITLEGVVSEVSWANPHITIYLDVTNDDDEVIKWALPTAAPGVARLITLKDGTDIPLHPTDRNRDRNRDRDRDE